jgi:flagellin FlaB
MKNIVEKRRKKNAGLTGIETAIILIAFVIVAAVFSFAVLNSGF